MSWRVTQLAGQDHSSSPHNNSAREEENTLNARDENQDSLFEIIPKLLLDLQISDGNSEDLGTNVFLASTTVGTSSTTLTNNDLVGIGFGKAFLVLSKDLNAVEKSLEFDSTIDFILWRKSVLLVGLSSSELILLNPTSFERTASKKVCVLENGNSNSRDQFFANAFIHPTTSPTKVDLTAVGINGDIYSFPGISLAEDCLEFTQEESMLSINIDIGNIKGTLLRSVLGEKAEVVSAVSPGSGVIAAGEKSGKVSVFTIAESPLEMVLPLYGDKSESGSEEERTCDFFASTNIIRDLEIEETDIQIKKLAHCGGLLFVLLSNGEMYTFDDENLMKVAKLKLPSSDLVIQDFALVMCNPAVVKLWMIYSNRSNDEHFIAIYPSPCFKGPEFSVKIPSNSNAKASWFRFPSQASLLDEPTSFVEVFPKCLSIKFYHMSECSTDISLQNLLAKGRFEKAELLARKYEKDLNAVWKAKVLSKASEIPLLQAKPKACDKVFGEMIQTLQLIDDGDWICGFIVKEKRMPKIDWVKELLKIGTQRVTQCSGSENGQKLLLTRKKLYTFEQVFPQGSISEWNEFNDERNTMFAQSIWFLDHDEFEKCQTVWLRHSDEFIPTIDLQDFAKFFRALFEAKLKSESSVSLFKIIFPFAVEKCEETEGPENGISMSKINGLMLLVRSRLRSLEREKTWPNEALEFTKTLICNVEDELQVLDNDKDNGSIEEAKVVKRIEICNKILKKLKYLLQALTELSLLKSNHSIRIPFEQYISDNLVEVVNSMLRLLLAREEVELFINKFLRPFALRNKLDMDELFLEHIKSVAEDVPYFVNASGIPFEERVVTLVKFVERTKTKLECVLKMAEHWPVPWFPLMNDLVDQTIGMNLQNSADIDIQNTIRALKIQVPYRCLQTKYRLVPHKLATGFGVHLALMRILKWKKPNCYEDCLELIKHTGKFDEAGLRTVKFWIELTETDLQVEDVVPNDLTDVEVLTKMLSRILLEFRTGKDVYQEKDWIRFTECGRLIANRINDEKTLEFFKLRSLIPNLWNDSILYSTNYPFSALELLLCNAHSKSSEQIMKECSRLSVISFTSYKNLLVIAAAFFVLPGPASALQKVWDIVGCITETEELLDNVGNDLTSKAALSVVHELILYSPTLSDMQLGVLHELCRLVVNSFSKAIEPVAKLFGILRMFETLREQEIPLEKEFLVIYKEVWREGIRSVPAFYESLQSLSESLLRFGNKELHCQIFNAVHLELNNQARNSYGSSKEKILEISSTVLNLKKTLLESSDTFVEEETNPRVLNLVKSLEEAGLTMNSYALRQRNKGRLIAKLLEMNLYQLASQTALVFGFKEATSWGNILQLYMKRATISDLKTLLESLKKIADLWVLPEFAEAWLKVSNEYKWFRNVCPIPLDY